MCDMSNISMVCTYRLLGCCIFTRFTRNLLMLEHGWIIAPHRKLWVRLIVHTIIFRLNHVMERDPWWYRTLGTVSIFDEPLMRYSDSSLQWCHNERGGVSNHRRLDCLLNCFFRRRSKITSKLRDFVRGIHRWPVDTQHKGSLTRKMFPFDDVIMLWSFTVYGSNAAKTLVKFGSDWTTLNTNVVASRVCEILRYDVISDVKKAHTFY